SAGEPSKPPGTWKSAISSLSSSVIASPACIQPSSTNSARSACTIWLSSYPENIRRSLSTTNIVEAINGQLEIMRRNSGGYFHSQDTLKLKLGLAVSSLEQGRWKGVAKNIAAILHQFNAM